MTYLKRRALPTTIIMVIMVTATGTTAISIIANITVTVDLIPWPSRKKPERVNFLDFLKTR